MHLADSREKVLLVDDEPAVLAALEILLEDLYTVVTAASGETAWQILQDEEIAVASVDLSLPDLSGLDLLRRLGEKGLPTELIMVTGFGTIDSAVEAMRHGAYDYLTKPVEGARLKQVIAKAIEKNALTVSNRAMATQLRELTRYEDLTGQSEAMREIYKLVEAVAKSDASTLITGESGTGKELVSRAIHQRSSRVKAPFIPVNCSALPADILENELFGHERGAFTGALNEKAGCFELADHGTLFLDEIGEMPYELQAKLLRALEEKKFRRLGGRKEIEVDVRVIAATNRDARRAVKEKTLREDLFYRLAVVEIELPPLRERIGDLVLLGQEFLQRYAAKSGKRIHSFSREALETLSRHTWPGNVRELRNVIERAVLLCSGRQIVLADLPKYLFDREDSAEIHIPLGTSLDESERRIIQRTLAAQNNNKTRAAEVLGISLKTLHNKLSRYRQDEA